MPEIAPLNDRQASRATMIQYWTGVFDPALARTRLLHAALAPASTKWKADIDALVEPEPVDRKTLPRKPVNANDTNPSLQAQLNKLQRQRNRLLEEIEGFEGRGDSPEAGDLWQRFGDVSQRFDACSATVQTHHDNYARELAAFEKGQASLQPGKAYDASLATLRAQLVALVARFNRDVDYDDPVTSREQYIYHPTSYVPTHHFYRSSVAGGTYFYVFEQNQFDVHLHCNPFDGEVSLITFKKWGSNAPFGAGRADTYLGDKRGLTLHSPHLRAGLQDERFVGLVKHLRTNYPPQNSATPQRVPPPLPRSR